MNRIITINLGGYALSIEEDAYDLLRAYLDKLQKHFGNDPQGREIIDDIEARMAEMFHEQLKNGRSFIRVEEVKAACIAMGEPSDMDTEDTQVNPSDFEREAPRRLFRDPENGIIGGVCSGLSVYFNTDVVVIRIIWLVLFFAGGIGFLPYLLMWMIVPKVQSKADRLAMHGKSPNLKNFQDAFMEEASRVGENIRRESKKGHWEQKAQSVARTFGTILLTFLKLFAGILGIGLLLGGIALLFGLSFGKIYTDIHLLPLSQIPGLLGLGNWTPVLKASLILLLLIPVISAIVFISHYVLGTQSLPAAVRKTLGILWTIALFSTVGLLIYAAMLFSEQEESLQKLPLSMNDTLTLESDVFEQQEQRLSFNKQNVRLNIISSTGTESELWVRKSSRGSSRKQALNSAERIPDLHQLNKGRIVLPGNIPLNTDEPYRAQEVEYTLRVPAGTYIKLHINTRDLIDHIDNLNQVWGKDLSGHLLFMSEKGLECVDCGTTDKTAERRMEHIEADGSFKIFVREGSGAAYEFRGDQTHAGDIEVEEIGSTLKISIREGLSWRNLPFSEHALPEIWIRSPELKSLRLIGAHQADLLDLTSEVLRIELDGASKLKANGLKTEILDLNMQGAAWMEVSGEAQKLLLKQEGAARFNGYKFKTAEATIDLSGASFSEIHAENRITGKAEGAAKLNYQGQPQINIEQSGAVRIKPEKG